MPGGSDVRKYWPDSSVMTTCSPWRAGDVATTVAPTADSPLALSRI